MPGLPGCVSPSLGVWVYPVWGSGIFPVFVSGRGLCAPTPSSQSGWRARYVRGLTVCGPLGKEVGSRGVSGQM
jgi:hypothetical protein